MIRFTSFPRTLPPEPYVEDIIAAFQVHEEEISTEKRTKGLTSDAVLATIHDELSKTGFELESGKRKEEKVHRPVYFGENGTPTVRYEIDGYHSEWKCGLEIEAGRSWMGNAVYRDIVHALVMVDVDHLVLAVPNAYKYKSGGRTMISKDYENTKNLADALFSHSRMNLPYKLTVVGY